MIDNLRSALTSSVLGLYWDDLSQHPLEIGKAVSWLQLSGFNLFPNKPSELVASGRVIYWDTNLAVCEQFIFDVVSLLDDFLLGQCVDGFSRIEVSGIEVSYSGQVEDSELDSLETYSLSLTFTITGTLKD